MRYAFYVSGKAGRLRNIIRENLHVLQRTHVVITDSEYNLDLKESLGKIGIDFIYFDYKKENLKHRKNTNQILSDLILECFKRYEIDYCFCFGDHILKGELLIQYENKIVNFHPSLLPLFPGRNAIDQALESKSTILLGNTAHFIDSGIDTGTIIMQSVVNKSFFEENGYDGILDLQIPMLESIFRKLEENNIHYNDEKVTVRGPSENLNRPSFYFY